MKFLCRKCPIFQISLPTFVEIIPRSLVLFLFAYVRNFAAITLWQALPFRLCAGSSTNIWPVLSPSAYSTPLDARRISARGPDVPHFDIRQSSARVVLAALNHLVEITRPPCPQRQDGGIPAFQLRPVLKLIKWPTPVVSATTFASASLSSSSHSLRRGGSFVPNGAVVSLLLTPHLCFHFIQEELSPA